MRAGYFDFGAFFAAVLTGAAAAFFLIAVAACVFDAVFAGFAATGLVVAGGGMSDAFFAFDAVGFALVVVAVVFSRDAFTAVSTMATRCRTMASACDQKKSCMCEGCPAFSLSR